PPVGATGRVWVLGVCEPIGASPDWRAWSTPAITVEATAPRPGRGTPRRPEAGAVVRALRAADDKRLYSIPVYCSERMNNSAGPPNLSVQQLDYLVAVHEAPTW